MKAAKKSSGAAFLPTEIIAEVLKRLPVKYLIRFQCVCSLWKNLINSPSFIGSQVDHSNPENLSLICRRNPYSATSTLDCLDRHMQLRQVENNPFIDRLKSLEIVGSCNGLLCVQIRESGTLLSLYLWNPATREVIQVPKSRTSMDLCYLCSLGFAFVNNYNIAIPYVTRSKMEYGIEVYSLATASWKKIQMPWLQDGRFLTDSIIFNGSLFWLATKRGLTSHEEDCTNAIASLHLAMDEFRLIPPPPLPMNEVDKLTVYENRLAVFHYSHAFNAGNTSINLWVIEEGIGGSWSKILTCGPYPYFGIPLAIWRNQIVCNVYPNCSVEPNDKNDAAGSYLFDPTSNEVKVLYSGRDGILHAVFTYAESLVPISNIHTLKALILKRNHC
ncbi:unnamed protein product [Cuscuta epithymum]|uniref:F-box domain-containing protein n=1 Tax=Cuscuta epithymum TaxID=186058 RepID=A0AAV0G3Q3_9ASTE|nr:unnamed protein product [Cuscuta epithymum]